LTSATQDIAQKGDRDGDTELNPRNVRKFLKVIIKHIPVAAEFVKSGPKIKKHNSSAIQNELAGKSALEVVKISFL